MSRLIPYIFNGRKPFTVILLAVFSVILTAVLLSCGEGNNTTAGGGTGGTGKHTGMITAFGSVFVNAIEFETFDALITADDADVEENSLRIGMKVQLEAVNSRALYITYEPEVKGPVAGVDKLNGTLLVLGQNIVAGSNTTFDGINGLQDLHAGDNIEVSGFFDSSGSIIATYIGLEDINLQEYKVKGPVTNHDQINSKFNINSLDVDYSQIQNPPVIEDGTFVQIKGTLKNNIFIAAELDFPSSFASSGEEYEIEGFITQVTSLSDFYVDGQRVRTSAETDFEHGTASDIALDVRVDVEGSVDSNGILIADEVEFHSP